MYHPLDHSTTRYQTLLQDQLVKCDYHLNPKHQHFILYKLEHLLQVRPLLQPLQFLELKGQQLNVQLLSHRLPLPLLTPLNFQLAQFLPLLIHLVVLLFL